VLAVLERKGHLSEVDGTKNVKSRRAVETVRLGQVSASAILSSYESFGLIERIERGFISGCMKCRRIVKRNSIGAIVLVNGAIA